MSKGMATALESVAQGPEIQTRMLVTIYATDALTFRFVANDNADLAFGGDVYTAASIKRGDIGTSVDGKKESVDLTLSNRWREWAAYLANNGNILNGRRCVIQEVFIDHLEEGAIWQFEGVLNKLKMTISEFSCSVERDLIDFDHVSPIMTYDPACQYVFKDFRCRYAGAAAACDHTFTRCKELGNITRFGGHPSIPRQMVIRSS